MSAPFTFLQRAKTDTTYETLRSVDDGHSPEILQPQMSYNVVRNLHRR